MAKKQKSTKQKSVNQMSNEEIKEQVKRVYKKAAIFCVAIIGLLFLYRCFGYIYVSGTVTQASEIREETYLKNDDKPSSHKTPDREVTEYKQDLEVSVNNDTMLLKDIEVKPSGYQIGDKITLKISRINKEDIKISN